MTEDPIRRAARWKLFYSEEGGLRDIIAEMKRTYLERMSQVEPWETGKLAKLAIANKICTEVDASVRAIIDAGTVAGERKMMADRIEKLPEAKRRWLV